MSKNIINGLTPINNILLVHKDKIIELLPDQVSTELVGEKAFGLACIPSLWTLPFFVVSRELVASASKMDHSQLHLLIAEWFLELTFALKRTGLDNEAHLTLRSSGINESIQNRGKFHTKIARSNKLADDLISWLVQIISDETLRNEQINLIIQKYSLVSAKGHLSNERRCSKESRDWLGEIENEKEPFQINLRNWRSKENNFESALKPLDCNIKISLQNVLKKAASWGTAHQCRLHFEWVWDGKIIYLVQADVERLLGNFDPVKHCKKNSQSHSSFVPKILSKISKEHGRKYHKINNVFTYMELDLPITSLYVLDNQEVIKEISNGNFQEELLHDIGELVRSSLVIRTDIVSDELSNKQLLPRTHEVRNIEDAKEWLISKSKILLSQVSGPIELAFIFHNFIPAEASAFAFSAPGERKVQIEALWGIPEGLYYNSHDNYIVDTLYSDIDKASTSIDNYVLTEKKNFKRNCVAPNENGTWINQIISKPYDWKSSIRYKKWIRKIARDSRLISTQEDKPLSIMWFVGVPKEFTTASVLPWYHEEYDLKKIQRSHGHRNKTHFDKIFEIKNFEDIAKLEALVDSNDKSIRRVLVKPQDEILLRDRNALQKIGGLVKKIDAVIFLEGATLSHAYYQLLQTGANVEAGTTFKGDNEQQVFNKLVRDKIPQKIESGGELVKAERLIGDDLLRALCEKLVEESLEVLDAKDHDSIIEELSDVQEVIDGILNSLKADMSEVTKAKERKLNKVGGFKDGVVLVKTTNPLPSTKYNLDSSQNSLPLNEFQSASNYAPYQRSETRINKWTDKSEHSATKEILLKVTAPIVLDSWKSETPQFLVGDKTISAEITTIRKKGDLEISLSVFAQQTQLKLF